MKSSRKVSCPIGNGLYLLITTTISEMIPENKENDRAFKDSKIFLSGEQITSLMPYNAEVLSESRIPNFMNLEVIKVDNWLKSGILDSVKHRFIPFFGLYEFDRYRVIKIKGDKNG